MPYFVYVTLSNEDRLNVYAMDPETGALDSHAIVAVGTNPGAMCVDPQQRFLYVGLRGGRQAAAFRLDKGSGRLAPMGTAPLEADPCFMATDNTGRFLLTSYYHNGMVAVHPIRRDGSVGTPAIQTVKTADHAHSIQVDASNRFAFVPHTLSSNVVAQFRFDDKTGRLASNPVAPRVEFPELQGPRHLTFHPAMDIVYFVNENGSSITACNFDTEQGTLAPFQTLSTLPEGFEGESAAAEIRITPTGEYVYASNRGHDSIAAYTVDGSTGALELISHTATEPSPRAFTLDPDGAFLFAAGENSGKLATYRIDDETGHLTSLETIEVGKGPLWVMALDLS